MKIEGLAIFMDVADVVVVAVILATGCEFCDGACTCGDAMAGAVAEVVAS